MLDSSKECSLRYKVASHCGMNDTDFSIFNKFAMRIGVIGDLSNERNCLLYVDAEQTFMQAAIESFGQQMTHTYNRGDKHIVMNGYQCYLKRIESVIQYEIETSKELGYNLGLKLVRGAYMNEERDIAGQNGAESPVWDTIEETHTSYNNCMTHAIANV